ncbi:hypothetical protein CCMSSC00406_0004888 [Pleurotus cornucopiae]|uniref:Uncharacterized protein n=1 Tax=Pleurotus cornucopiae TaxID=5321 RepID=A0ACB7J1G8_PLECO|nr:hypothetical protein CCMSSC00406_0004888 [Pleurotus cornucopiae]
MQFSLRLKLLPVVALAAMVIASPAATSRDVEASIVSDAEFDNWLRTTDADITFVGNAKALAERNALNTRVVYCSSRSGSAPSALWPQPTSRSATELGANPTEKIKLQEETREAKSLKLWGWRICSATEANIQTIHTDFTPMHLALKLASLIALATMATAVPAFSNDVEASVANEAEFDNWLRTTDANLTFIGSARQAPVGRNVPATRVVYCNRRSVCGGECTVYEGGSACLNALHISCLSATITSRSAIVVVVEGAVLKEG